MAYETRIKEVIEKARTRNRLENKPLGKKYTKKWSTSISDHSCLLMFSLYFILYFAQNQRQ